MRDFQSENDPGFACTRRMHVVHNAQGTAYKLTVSAT